MTYFDPKGWKLPGSYGSIMNAYGFPSRKPVYGDYSIFEGPFYFVMGGSVYINSGEWRGGNFGGYWQRDTYDDGNTDAFNFDITLDDADATGRASRSCVYSLRCLSTN